MVLPRFAMCLALWVASSCLLTGWASAQEEVASQRPGSPGDLLCSGTESSDPSCPWRKKAATLLPAFTKTTTPRTTHHPKTTPHPTTHATNHTTLPANYTTARPTNHTTPFHNHTTARPTNHTTPFPTTAPTNHTTPRHPANHTTPHTITTTALGPTDAPLVAVGNYVARNGSTACVRLEAGLQLQVHYTSTAKRQLWGAFAVQPNHTNASGTCSSEAATLRLHFPEGFLLFTFRKNETKGTSYLSRVQANLTYQFRQATGASFGADSSSLQEFEASLGHSYQCRNRTLALNEDVHLYVLNERVQAFEVQDGKFGEAEVCKEQRRSPLVPIIVFVVIAILVIIVLVAYVVGRRRSHTGYETL